VVVGAGIGGLVAALTLASRGLGVTVVERAASPGGKMREVLVGGAAIDAGPTVLTMAPLFEEIFAEAGATLADHVGLRPAEILARHAWREGEQLDLFADKERSAEAIGDFAGAAEARGYRVFCARAERMFRTLDKAFIRSARPSLPGLVAGAGLKGLPDLMALQPFATMWRALCDCFDDPRLRQLFGRYATYCGSSPFAAPATLMLVAHVEQSGVWLVEGGMHRLAAALASLCERLGVRFRYGAEATEIVIAGAGARGVTLAGGERLDADAVVVNADVAALAGGLFGPGAARAAPRPGPESRSLSAVTWSLLAEPRGFPLVRHNVFFSRDYRAEFDDIFGRATLPAEPTVYVCAQDRGDRTGLGPGGPERLLCLVNAPARGDTQPFDPQEIARCEERTFGLLERCGLRVHRSPGMGVATTPADFARLFPGTGGALYGRASHGWRASFQRPGSRSRVPGLYLAGGSTHPGPGVPMAALSGRAAAASLLADLASRSASTAPSRRTAMRGGMSTP